MAQEMTFNRLQDLVQELHAATTPSKRFELSAEISRVSRHLDIPAQEKHSERVTDTEQTAAVEGSSEAPEGRFGVYKMATVRAEMGSDEVDFGILVPVDEDVKVSASENVIVSSSDDVGVWMWSVPDEGMAYKMKATPESKGIVYWAKATPENKGKTYRAKATPDDEDVRLPASDDK